MVETFAKLLFTAFFWVAVVANQHSRAILPSSIARHAPLVENVGVDLTNVVAEHVDRRQLRVKSITDDPEYQMLMSLKPLIEKPPNIQFWRPQKVGSSTILSLLVSFSFRYNILPKRKASQNLLCRKIAKCAVEYLNVNGTFDASSTGVYAGPAGLAGQEYYKTLQHYVLSGKWPPLDEHGRPVMSIDRDSRRSRNSGIDRVSELIGPSHVSLLHELCYLDDRLIRDHMECAFSMLRTSGTGTGSDGQSRNKGSTGDSAGREGEGGGEGEGESGESELRVKAGPEGHDSSSGSLQLSEKDKINVHKAMALFGRNTAPVFPLNAAVTTPSQHLDDSSSQRSPGGTSTDTDTKNPNAQGGLKELFVIREPLARAISVYYFWGELFAMKSRSKVAQRQDRSSGGGGRVRGGQLRPRAVDMLAAVRARAETEAAGSAEVPVLPITPDRRRLDAAGAQYVSGGRQLSAVMDFMETVTGKLKFRTDAIGQRAANPNGSGDDIVKGFFVYHGNESTVPPMDIAMQFANGISYNQGSPGPTLTWSLFSQSLTQSSRIVTQTDRIMTLVTDRLDESLVVAAHYMGWSLADVVTVKNRKALSSHPSEKDWPEEAISALRDRLEKMGEFDMYRAAVQKLDSRLRALRDGTWNQSKQGTGTPYAPLRSKVVRDYSKPVDVDTEIALLQALRKRVSELCDLDEYLQRYRKFLETRGLPLDISLNKLRDGHDKYADGGHMFAFNKVILFSYDVCGSCEAHAILLGYNQIKPPPSERKVHGSVEAAVNSLPALKDLPPAARKGNIDFMNCPF
jgi:hypothetical protein